VERPGVVAEYHYDALGRRIEKNVNGVVTRYIYDNEDIVAEVDGTNTVQALYLHGPGIDEPLAVFREGRTVVYHADGLGSITILTDLNGIPVRSYTYDSFGRLVAQTGTVGNPYTYTARELDPESGLFYYRARYYDPTIGRFLQEDIFGGLPRFPQSLNRFVYVANNPVNFLDPTGLVVPQALIAAGTGAAIGFVIGGVTAALTGGSFREVVGAAISGGISGGVAAGLAALGVPFPMAGALGNLASQGFAELRAGTIGTPSGFLRVGFSAAIGVGVGGLAGQVLPEASMVGQVGLAGLNAQAKVLSNRLFSAVDVVLDFFRGRTDSINRLIGAPESRIACP
jgi:RHS repeat-associated protein